MTTAGLVVGSLSCFVAVGFLFASHLLFTWGIPRAIRCLSISEIALQV